MSRAQLTSTVEQSSGGVVAPFLAGKNKIINGDFGIWQRGTSFSFSGGGAGVYTADRWLMNYSAGTGTAYSVSQQAFTPGAAPVTGYESAYYLQWQMTNAGSGNTANQIGQRIEDVRTFAGQTVTISMWAKADSTRVMGFYADQNFGSGGSSTQYNVISNPSISLTTSWQRVTFTATIPSVSGKTIGAGSYLLLGFSLPSGTTSTISFWGVQIEAGSVATPFTTASGTLQGELALAQRYYFRQSFVAASQHFGLGQCFSSTQAYAVIPFPVTMRTAPTSVETTGSAGDYILLNSAASGVTCTAVPTFSAGWNNAGQVVATVGSGLTAGNATKLGGLNATSAAYLGWSAEL